MELDPPISDAERQFLLDGDANGWRFQRCCSAEQQQDAIHVYMASCGALSDSELLALLRPFGRILHLQRDGNNSVFCTFPGPAEAAKAVAALNGQPCSSNAGSRKLCVSRSVLVKPKARLYNKKGSNVICHLYNV